MDVDDRLAELFAPGNPSMETICACVRDAVADERERCARICDVRAVEYALNPKAADMATDIGAAIRSGVEPGEPRWDLRGLVTGRSDAPPAGTWARKIDSRPGDFCHAYDTTCDWPKCPQVRDDEPRKTGRHCPLDARGEDDGRGGGDG